MITYKTQFLSSHIWIEKAHQFIIIIITMSAPKMKNPKTSLIFGYMIFSKKLVFPLISLTNDLTGSKSSNMIHLFQVLWKPLLHDDFNAKR